MSDTKPLLVELGTEELPPKALPELARAFADGVLAGLDKRGIGCDRASVRALYSPRRLAVRIDAVAATQPTQRSEALGPYLNVGLDAAGEPTPALRGFAAKQGVDVAALERTTDAKGERFVARREAPGAATAGLLPAIVAEALAALPIPKPMRWGARDVAFIRPVHWLVLLLGADIVEGRVLGLAAGRTSRGHRFHHPDPVVISHPEAYLDILRAAQVLADPDERRALVRMQIDTAAAKVDGVARVAEALLEEVNNLVEWPHAVLCAFDRAFLRVPQEALISTMEANQKFFPVLNAEHRLTEHFIGVANVASRDPAVVRQGYERVIRPRFADAQFFFDEDRKQGLAGMLEGLASVTYQQKLGSYADKTIGVTVLAGMLARELGLDAKAAVRAAALAKADLQSRLVGEFPELQGIAGRYYAGAAGEDGEIADAIDHAYQPRFAGDGIAQSPLGQVLAIAERLDTLAGGFAAGLKPTGNKDPFSLRRAALGLARTVIEGGLAIDVRAHLALAHAQVANALECTSQWGPAKLRDMTLERFEDTAREMMTVRAARGPLLDDEVTPARQAAAEALFQFVLDRLRAYYADQGVTAAQFDAVAERPDADGVLLDFDRRLRAVRDFAALPEAEALAAANKRIRNILRKAVEAGETIAADVDASALREPAELALADAVAAARADTDAQLAARDYVGVLHRLAALRAPVDAFFDGVMVMADDAAVRRNRLALLARLADRFAQVAAIDRLATG
jgi:glycyl-tRNA synthetase beta chain